MKNGKSNSKNMKTDCLDEGFEEDANANDDNSNLILNDEDSNESQVMYNKCIETEEESSSDSSSVIQQNAKAKRHTRPNILLSDTSESGDESCENCAICLRPLHYQEVGSPEGCDHLFCSICIIEWSKNSNVCPLDRQQFSIILIRKNKNGNIVKQLPVEEPKSSLISYEDDEDDSYCEICGENDREDTMLLCDGCQRGFHLECLTPPLEQVPAEEEWFCPSCLQTGLYRNNHNVLGEEINLVRNIRSEEPSRGSESRTRNRASVRVRTLERIRVAVSRIVSNYFDDSNEDNDTEDEDFLFEDSKSESLSEESLISESQPGTSGTQKKTKISISKRTKKNTKSKIKKNVKKSCSKRKIRRKSRKSKTAGNKKTSRKATFRTKRLKFKDTVGTIKIVKTKTYKKRRKPRVKKKGKAAASVKKSAGARTNPETVRERLALTLDMVPRRKPGQLLPDMKIRPRRSDLSGIDISRARAGIPRLHLFEPRNDFIVYSSASDGEGLEADDNGPVATLSHPRITLSTVRDRKRAALLLQSSSSSSVKPRTIVKESQKEVDILGSILDSQAIWHSKNTNVKINGDGSIEVIGGGNKTDIKLQREDKNMTDIQGNAPTSNTTQAPLYPGSNSRPGGFRSYNRNNFGDSRGNQDSSSTSRGPSNQSAGMGFSRFGGTPRSDREDYANYLNSIPQGPTPFCRGGPPLRFRMPNRQQLRRFPFPPRVNRAPWQNEEEDENESKNGNKGEQSPKNNDTDKKADEDDVDLYSDIETNPEKEDNSEHEEGGTIYPALGPPPEPSAFLLGIDENGEIAEAKNKSEVYDPAEPCDSEDEMVIDEQGGEVATFQQQRSLPSNSETRTRSPTCEMVIDEHVEAPPPLSKDNNLAFDPALKASPVDVTLNDEQMNELPQDEKKEETLFGSESGKKSPFNASHSAESEKSQMSKTPCSSRGKSSSTERSLKDVSKIPSSNSESDSDIEPMKRSINKEDEAEKPADVINEGKVTRSGSDSPQTKIATGLEGLDVELVSSDDGDGDDFMGKRSASSLSLSDLSTRSKDSVSLSKRKKKKRKRKVLKKLGTNYEEGGIEEKNDSKINEIDKKTENGQQKFENEDIENIGQLDKSRKKKSKSIDSDRQILGTKENKKEKYKEVEKDLSWKKPSRKEKNYREGKKRSKDRGRSRSRERRKSNSPSPKKDKKRNKDKKKKTEKKKEIERYDVRKIVKNKEIRKTDVFGRDIISKSRSMSRSRSRTPIRERSRNMLRRNSRSFTRSRSRSYRRGRSPNRRRYIRSRSRSKSFRRSFSRSRSRSRSPRKSKKKFKSKERLKIRSRSRGRKSRSRWGSLSRSRTRSPLGRMLRGKKQRLRRSWSHHSRSLSFSPRRSRSLSRSPLRFRRSYSRSRSSSWSRGRSPMTRAASLEKLTVVLKTKDKKKGKKKRDGKKGRRLEEKKKGIGNSKEVFASGDNVLVSVNFRNNNNSSNNNNGSANNDNCRTRLDSMSPLLSSDKKKKRGSEYEGDRISKKSKKSSVISKNVVDMALSNSCSKRAKRLTRLSEKDAEVILNRKPVAVIDLDISPYREQTPSPINVVVVSDSGSGDEGKEQTVQRQNVHDSPCLEPGKSLENADVQIAQVSVPSSPVTNGYPTGPKTPPEPQVKFSIAKMPQLRQIANPLGDDDDDDDDEDAEEDDINRIESLDCRIEKELDATHKGPNTPPEPRGPATPKTPPSPQTSPDAYDPFEPTKSRSPTPTEMDKDNRPSPAPETKVDDPIIPIAEVPVVMPSGILEGEQGSTDDLDELQDSGVVATPSTTIELVEKGEAIPVLDCSSTMMVPVQSGSEIRTAELSPERKISVVITTSQGKIPSQVSIQKPYTPVLKQISMAPVSSAGTPNLSSNLAASFSTFSAPSPTKTPRTSTITVSQPVQVSGIQRLQHRLGSPVNRTPSSVKSTPEKRLTPRIESTDVGQPGNFKVSMKRSGDQGKQARQDATNETIDMTAEMEDSPYSPASSEGDDLFDPPTEPMKSGQTNSKSIQPGYKPPPSSKTQHKSPIKQVNKFDLLFGPSGPTLSPLRVGSKKTKSNLKPGTQPKILGAKQTKKNSGKRGISLKMDEDQLRILDELPSSAVELQVKDKFLKKLNRQERVVDEVKTVLKPHYARKHITKEEYKDILRRSVPKICHSRSGEINPSKIQSLIEAYVRKFRHAKRKGSANAVTKPKVK